MVGPSLPVHSESAYGGVPSLRIEEEPGGIERLGECNPNGYDAGMIKSFSHKGLGHFFYNGTKRGTQTKHAERIGDI